MAIVDLGVTVAVLLAVAVSALLVVGRTRSPRPPHPQGEAVRRIRSRTTGWRLAGTVVGVVAAALLAGPADWLGLGAALAGPAFALCLLVGVIGGEALGRRPAGVTRTAVVEVRSMSAFLPRGLLTYVVGLGGLLAAVLVLASVAASPDDQGRPGRVLAMACGVTIGPWPGSSYSVPIAASVLIGLILAGLAARAVVRRPRPPADEAGRAMDNEIRRTSGRVITAAAGILIGVPLSGSALLAGRGLVAVDCASTAMRTLGVVALAVGVVAATSSTVFLALLLRPAAHGRGDA